MSNDPDADIAALVSFAHHPDVEGNRDLVAMRVGLLLDAGWTLQPPADHATDVVPVPWGALATFFDVTDTTTSEDTERYSDAVAEMQEALERQPRGIVVDRQLAFHALAALEAQDAEHWDAMSFRALLYPGEAASARRRES